MNALINSFEQTIEAGRFRGQKFRYTNDTPRKVSIIDWIMMIAKTSNENARKILERAKKSNPEVVTKMSRHIFPGQGQRATPVASARDLLYIVGKLPPKYIVDFEREREDLVTRYLGGDTSLVPEVCAIRAAQETLAESNPDHPMRVFGEAVESGQTGRYVDERSEARAKSIEAYHDKVEAMKSNPVTNDCQLYIETNAKVSRASLGVYPSQFKRDNNLKSWRSSRSYMNADQLKSVALCETAVKNIATSAHTPEEYKSQITEMTDMLHEFNRRYGIHNSEATHPRLDKPIEDVRGVILSIDN